MVVLFDVDRTLVGVNCTAVLSRALASDGIVDRSAVASVAVQQILYRAKCRSFSALMASAYGLLEGCEISRVEACAERIVKSVVAQSLYEEAVARINMHRARGDRVVLASAAPAVIVRYVAARVDVSEVIATEFERVGPRFGRFREPQAHGEGKVELARRAGLLNDGRPHVYTDHLEDWALVRAAGFATLVNPSRRLAREAQRHGIAHEIVRWGVPH